MPRIEPVAREAISPDLTASLAAIEGSNGYIPNSYFIMAHSPRIMKAYMDLAQVVIRDDGSVDKGLKFLVAYISSRTAGCYYCQAHNLRSAARWGVSDEKLDAAWEFGTSPLYGPHERVALEFAIAASTVPNSVDDDLMARLQLHFSNEQIVEMLCVVSLFGWNNRFNDSAGTDLDVSTYEWATATAARSRNGWIGETVAPAA